MNRNILSKEPWPAIGINHYRSIDDGPWGYLILYDDGKFEFDDSQQPSDKEIVERWSSYLTNLPQD